MADAAALDPPRLAERIDRLRLDLLVQSIRRAPVWLLLPFNAFCARLLWRSGWRGWRGWSGVCGSAATSAWPPRVYALCSLMLGGAMVCGWLAHRDGLGVGMAVLVAGLTLLLVQQVGAQQQARHRLVTLAWENEPLAARLHSAPGEGTRIALALPAAAAAAATSAAAAPSSACSGGPAAPHSRRAPGPSSAG